MKRQQNRALGAFEKAFWLLDQIDSKDFCLAADISELSPSKNGGWPLKWHNSAIRTSR